MGRTELARDAGLRYRDMEEAGAFLAVVDLKVRYRSPARYDDELTLTTTVARATRVKLIHTYELMRDGVLLATGETTIACLDRDGKPTLMPDILTKLHD